MCTVFHIVLENDRHEINQYKYLLLYMKRDRIKIFFVFDFSDEFGFTEANDLIKLHISTIPESRIFENTKITDLLRFFLYAIALFQEYMVS